MKRWSCISISVGALLIACRGEAAVANQEGLRAAALLSSEFETVVYADGAALRGSPGDRAQADLEGLRFPFLLLQSALGALGADIPNVVETSAAAVVVGAKDFRAPIGLGGVHSRRCYVVVLKDGRADLVRKLFHGALTRNAGRPVWQWSAHLGEFGEESSKPSVFFAAEVQDSYLLVSNGSEELHAVARDLTSFPPSFRSTRGEGKVPRDWSFTSNHELWGYRRYRRSADVDLTAAGLKYVNASAETIGFFLDENRIVVLRVFCARDEACVSKRWPNDLLPLRAVGSSAWESRIGIAGASSFSDSMFAVLGLLGFGAFL